MPTCPTLGPSGCVTSARYNKAQQLFFEAACAHAKANNLPMPWRMLYFFFDSRTNKPKPSGYVVWGPKGAKRAATKARALSVLPTVIA